MEAEEPAGALSGIADQGFLARLSSPDLISEFTRSAPSVYYPKGSIAFSARDGAVAALIVSGALRYYLAGSDGRQLTIRYLGPGDLVGSLVTERSNLATRIQALEPSVLLQLDVGRIRELARRRPDLSEALLDEMTSRLRFAFSALAASAFMPVRARVARDLLERAKMHGPPLPGRRLDVTQQSLADATGSVREVVARAVRELRVEGVIANNGDGMTVLDPEGLARLAQM
jgi:CRP/FNR family transcriptional regulator